jgi:hypothetical protein
MERLVRLGITIISLEALSFHALCWMQRRQLTINLFLSIQKKNSYRNGVDYETFAAVARTKQMHRQLNPCCHLIILDLRVYLFDIKAASVYEKIDGETYMPSPKGVEGRDVCVGS